MIAARNFSLSSRIECAPLAEADPAQAATLIAAVLEKYAPIDGEIVGEEESTDDFPEVVLLQAMTPRGTSTTVEAGLVSVPEVTASRQYKKPNPSVRSIAKYLMEFPGRGFRKPELLPSVKSKSHAGGLVTVKRALAVLAVAPPHSHRLYAGEDGFTSGRYYSLIPSTKSRENADLLSQLAASEWENGAACRAVDPRIFDQLDSSIKRGQANRSMPEAKSICSGCAVSTACLANSLSGEDVKDHMIQSALGDAEREAIVAKSRWEGPIAAARFALELQQAGFAEGHRWHGPRTGHRAG